MTQDKLGFVDSAIKRMSGLAHLNSAACDFVKIAWGGIGMRDRSRTEEEWLWWAKALAVNPDDLSSIPGILTVEEEN